MGNQMRSSVSKLNQTALKNRSMCWFNILTLIRLQKQDGLWVSSYEVERVKPDGVLALEAPGASAPSCDQKITGRRTSCLKLERRPMI